MKVYVETQGCSANRADTEQMLGLLEQAGHTVVDTSDKADTIILNTCTVKGPTERAFYKRLKELDGKDVVVAGCIAQSEPKQLEGYTVVGPQEIDNIVNIVKEKGQHVDRAPMPKLNTPVKRANPLIDIITINRGCLGYCTFCKTKSARGSLRSYTVEDIMQRFKQALDDGCKEIWLTSQDTGCYGFDIGTNLPTLLRTMLTVPGDYRIRVGMMNPDHLGHIMHELAQVYQDDRIFKFLHLPLQAGNDLVLKDMKRLYTQKDYLDQIRFMTEQIPGLHVMTDIIVGFPTEADDQFIDTITVLESTKPESVNISKFWPRPRTPAARMKPLQGHIVKARSKQVHELFESYRAGLQKQWLNTMVTVRFTEKKGEQVIGKDQYYRQVISDTHNVGDMVTAKVVRVGTYALFI